jgi:hypothetical protein
MAWRRSRRGVPAPPQRTVAHRGRALGASDRRIVEFLGWEHERGARSAACLSVQVLRTRVKRVNSERRLPVRQRRPPARHLRAACATRTRSRRPARVSRAQAPRCTNGGGLLATGPPRCPARSRGSTFADPAAAAVPSSAAARRASSAAASARRSSPIARVAAARTSGGVGSRGDAPACAAARCAASSRACSPIWVPRTHVCRAATAARGRAESKRRASVASRKRVGLACWPVASTGAASSAPAAATAASRRRTVTHPPPPPPAAP